MKRALLALVVLVACSMGAQALAGSDPGVKCESSKLKEIGKYFACRLKADAKATTTGFLPVYTDCTDKFSEKFTGVETKAGSGVCPSEGNLSAVEQCIAEAATACAELVGAPVCDEGDCSACVTCANEGACADELLACTSDTDCQALMQCLTNCAPNFEQTCLDACTTTYQSAVPLLQAVGNCQLEECPTTCGP